jgi:phosphoribosyl 1,2-cyclic phosphodiesterase
MNVSLWGVRGSIPVTGPETAGYGGNTSCISVYEDGWLLVLDGGSGIHQLTMPEGFTAKRIDILLTHLHLDHIQGLGFFQPLFDPEMEINIWGPGTTSRTLHSRLSRYLSPPLFPVLIRDLPCKLNLHDVENSDFEIGPFKIMSRFVIHPGPTVGFRVTSNHHSVTFLPDHEPALGAKKFGRDANWTSGFDLAYQTDLLFHDAQYTSDEYKAKQGWGHSSMEDAIRFAALCEVDRLLLAHHDPSRSDVQLDAFYDDLKRTQQLPFTIEFAKERSVFKLE